MNMSHFPKLDRQLKLIAAHQFVMHPKHPSPAIALLPGSLLEPMQSAANPESCCDRPGVPNEEKAFLLDSFKGGNAEWEC